MKNPMKQLMIIWIIATMMLTGCNKNEEPDVAQVNQPAMKSIDPNAKESMPKKGEPVYQNVFPLTGIRTENEINHRVFAVMVNNHPKARPQSGLHKADIVYEILAEGEITRYLAIFQSELPDIIGPVRSARDYFIYLSKGLDAIYVAYGGSPEAFDLLQHREITDYIGGILRKGYADDHFFYRAKFRKAPHNVYITNKNLIKGAKQRDYSLTQNVTSLPFLTEEDIKSISGDEAKEVIIKYSNTYKTSFTYDEDTQKYTRYINGKKYTDRETEIPIMVDNLFIIEAPHKIVDSDGRRNINLNGSGKGYLVQRGIVQHVDWENNNGRILPYIDGNEVGFVPGKTWVNVIPDKPGLAKTVTFGIETRSEEVNAN